MLFIIYSERNRIEEKTIHNISNKLSKNNFSCHIINIKSIKIREIYNILSILINSKTVAVHSPLFITLPFLMVSKLMNKKTVGFIWDTYPVTLDGIRYDNRITRLILDFIENLSLSFCEIKIIPSTDFFKVNSLQNSTKINYWPEILTQKLPARLDKKKEKLKIIFSGQINTTRDLAGAIRKIRSLSTTNIEFIVASKDLLPDELLNDNDIKYIGFKSETELKKVFLDCDFGLISLSKNFDGPGFPSKTFDYIKAGLPCLYYGPRLLNYIHIIEESGVGLDLDKITTINQDTLREASRNFEKKIKLFENMACLTDESIKILVKTLS